MAAAVGLVGPIVALCGPVAWVGLLAARRVRLGSLSGCPVRVGLLVAAVLVAAAAAVSGEW